MIDTSRILLFITLSACAVFPCASANAVNIDRFDSGNVQFVSSVGVSGFPNNRAGSSAGSGIVGGEREINISTSSILASVIVTGGLLNYATGASETGGVEIVWDGLGDDPTTVSSAGLGGRNLTAGGHRSLLVRVRSSDFLTDLNFTVASDAANASTYTVPISAQPKSRDYLLPYFGFTPVLGSGADFSDVGSIVLSFGNRPDLNLRLDLVRTSRAVPEPAGLAMLVSFLAVGWTAIRRRRPI